MALTYLDQNALIGLGRKARVPDFRGKVDSALESGALSVVVSTWHLIETANSPRLEPAIELAEFIDSLRSAWLFERHDILLMEVADDFYTFAHIEHQSASRVATRSAVIAALNRTPDSARFNIPSAQFVAQWWKHRDQLHTLEAAYKHNAESLLGIRELKKQGKLTDDVLSKAIQTLLEHTVPTRTPAGLEVGHETRAKYIAQVKEEAIPTLAIEKAISEHEWDAQGGADRNTLIDKFHLIAALPYVDEIVSDDGFFHTIYPAAAKTGYVRAALIKNEEFLKRFK
jgi:hypothetical protein